MDREAWRAAVHGVAKSGTGLSETGLNGTKEYVPCLPPWHLLDPGIKTTSLTSPTFVLYH